MPHNLETEILAAGGVAKFEGSYMEKGYTSAFVNTNQEMHDANFDDSLSGTTGITIFIKGDVLYVANVGDSRAIMGTMNSEGVLRAMPLSMDQTPFRKDERDRLKARV